MSLKKQADAREGTDLDPHLFRNLRQDLPASLVVFLVAVPLCLGIALASGAPLISGLVAGIVGGIVVGMFSGSALGVSGPAAGLAVIVFTAIQDLGSFEIFLVAVILAGAIQIVLSLLRAGIIAYFFPSSVITGMLSGIGIIIFLKQIPHAFGYDRDPVGELAFNQPDGETTFSELGRILEAVSPGATVIAFVSLGILLAWETRLVKERKFLSLLPGPLVAVVVGTVLGVFFQSSETMGLKPDQLVTIPVGNGLGSLASMVSQPDFSGLMRFDVYKTAVVLAIVASLETLLSVEATDKLDPFKRVTPTNRELKAQGIGNMISGFIGGLPITQVIVRSSANVQSGGRTKLSTIMHGFWLIISVIALPSVMNMIPLASLAAVLLVVGYKLAKPVLFKRMFSQGMGQFLPFMITILGIVFTDLLIGIGLGIHAAAVGILFQNFRLPFQMDGLPQEEGESVRITLAQHVTFLNKASIRKTLDAIPTGSSVIIDASRSSFIHPDVIEIIDDFVIAAGPKGIDVTVIGLDGHKQGQAPTGMQVSVKLPSEAEEPQAESPVAR